MMIPPQLNRLLGDSVLGDAVRLYTKRFKDFIGDETKGLFFFPEYTNHGPKHITSVLAACEALIGKDAWANLTPEDAATLIIAVLLHDSAMHLTADGFIEILDGRWGKHSLLQPLDKKDWSKLFAEFFMEARRWDQRKLQQLLGDRASLAAQEDLVDYIRHPHDLPNPEEWSIRYRKFLGEFVRRHHARLAHEIAHFGFPGYTPGILAPGDELERLSDLAGLVARSHNMNPRATFESLVAKYEGRVTCRNTHPVFLMTLLRIADYIDFGEYRANKTLFQIQRLRSPLSQEEWEVNFAVQDVKQHEQDTESLLVIVEPKNSQTFFRLTRLLNGLQEELDLSWSILGEVFSRFDGLRNFGLSVRRVRSNIEDPAKFFKLAHPTYFPIEASFQAAGADLLKLLIKPLYGDRPEIAIRELLQNSVDAVREVGVWSRDRDTPFLQNAPRAADIIMSFETDDGGKDYFVIDDNGIGMKPDTIRDYFLKAGASFRQSEAWRARFEKDGKSMVLRSGRFGVGVLAAFLLGERIEVLTRHVDSSPEEGVRFTASIFDETIELQRVSKPDIGTTIRIELGVGVAKQFEAIKPKSLAIVITPRMNLFWDWYTLANPSVERIYLSERLGQAFYLPSLDEPIPNDWRRISHPDYQAIFWSYSSAPSLTCNGLIVEMDRTSRNIEHPHPFRLPAISVFDANGKLPLTLHRDRLETTGLPFVSDLRKSLRLDWISYLLVHSPTKPSEVFSYSMRPDIFFGSQTQALLRTKEGSVHARRLLGTSLRRALWLDVSDYLGNPVHEIEIDSETALYVTLDKYSSRGDRDAEDKVSLIQLQHFMQIPLKGLRLLLPEWHVTEKDVRDEDIWEGEGKKAVRLSPSNWPGSQVRVKKLPFGWQIWERGTVPQSGLALESLQAEMLQRNVTGANMALEAYFEDSIEQQEEHEDFPNVAIIPFDPEQRRLVLKKFFSQLKEFVSSWESGVKGWRSTMCTTPEE